MSSAIHENMSHLSGESGGVSESIGDSAHVSSAEPSDNSTASALMAAFHFTGNSASANGATMQEYFVQSVVSSEQQHDLLLTRLRGLSREWTEFCDQEISLQLLPEERPDVVSASSNRPISNTISTAAHAIINPTVNLRVRRSLLPANQYSDRRLSVLRYLGAVETDKFVSRRSCLIVPVTGPLLSFLQELGFEPEFTYVTDGQMFIRGRTKVCVYTVNQVTQFDSMAPLNPQMDNIIVQDPIPKEWRRICPRSWMVEISAVGCPADDSLQEEVADFTDLLHPLITPGKIDLTTAVRK